MLILTLLAAYGGWAAGMQKKKKKKKRQHQSYYTHGHTYTYTHSSASVCINTGEDKKGGENFLEEEKIDTQHHSHVIIDVVYSFISGSVASYIQIIQY